MEYTHRCSGTCSRSVSFIMDENHIVTDVRFVGGCSGNTQGVAKLCEGRKAEELIELMKGIRCGFKSTSCPDQLAIGLQEALAAALQTV